jgi:hypothetical protein
MPALGACECQINSLLCMSNHFLTILRHASAMPAAPLTPPMPLMNAAILLRRTAVSRADGKLFFCGSPVLGGAPSPPCCAGRSDAAPLAIDASNALNVRHSVECENFGRLNSLRVLSAAALWLIFGFELYSSIAKMYT